MLLRLTSKTGDVERQGLTRRAGWVSAETPNCQRGRGDNYLHCLGAAER